MTERKSNRRDEKLEAHGIKRKDWVAQAIALAGMHGTGARRAQGKRGKRDETADASDDADDDAHETEGD